MFQGDLRLECREGGNTSHGVRVHVVGTRVQAKSTVTGDTTSIVVFNLGTVDTLPLLIPW